MRQPVTSKTWRSLLADALDLLGPAERLSAERLMAKVRGMSRASVLAHLDDAPSAEEAEAFQKDVGALHEHRPLQYLLGEAPFADFSLCVDDRVLIPRFDTEILVGRAAEKAQGGCRRILDLCTGSGAVALALARACPEAQVYASDISGDALEVAQANARRLDLDLTLRCGDLFFPWQGESFDLITANPPYISTAEMEPLAPEVLREPHRALWGGDDGLLFYKRLVKEAPAYLKPDGYLLCEIGAGQGAAVSAIFERAGFTDLVITQDWGERPRVVEGRRGR